MSEMHNVYFLTILKGLINEMYRVVFVTRVDLIVNNNNNNNIYLKSNIQCTYRYEFSGLYNNNIQLQ